MAVPDIGGPGAADTSTYHPVWIRVYAPGGLAAQLREGQEIQVTAVEDPV